MTDSAKNGAIKGPRSEDGICPECGRKDPEDERIQAGMKCSKCAY